MSDNLAVRVSVAAARRAAFDSLVRAGVPREASEIQADQLIEGELRGHPSHGLLRLPRVIERIRNGVSNPATRGVHVWLGDALLKVDGQDGLGPVIATSAIEAIVTRAQRTGVATAVISRSNHLGMLSTYVERMALRGFVGIAMTTSEALVHPWNGRRAMIGSNPLAIGVPAEPGPLVLDMATSSVSMGKIHHYAAVGMALMDGWAIDADGEPTTDAEAAIGGALTPFGAKGYALSVAIEAAVGALTDSALGQEVHGTLDSVLRCTKGDVFIAIRASGADRLDAVSSFLNDVRHSPRQCPDEPIRIPGDTARLARQRSPEVGIDVEPGLWRNIEALASSDPSPQA